jgi:hypothetical protein
MRKVAPEIDRIEEQRRLRESSFLTRRVVGPMELRFPIFAHFLDRLHESDTIVEPPILPFLMDFLNWQFENDDAKDDPLSFQRRTDEARRFLEKILDVSLLSVSLPVESSTVLYRDADMAIHLEARQNLAPLEDEPSLEDEYNRAKWMDDDGCYTCPHAAFTVVLTPTHLGIYGSLVNAMWISQQWLTPLYPISCVIPNDSCAATGEAINSDVARMLIALRESIKDLRQVLLNPFIIPDIPVLGELVNFEEYLTLDYPLVRGTFVFRGKYGKHDVVTKICRSYCIKAHELLAKEKMAPKLYWHGELAGRQWKVIVMQHLDGRPRRKLKDTQIAACECVLARLHELGFVHGDARSCNFVWSPSKKPLLIDFDHAGAIGDTFYPPALNSMEVDPETYYSVGRAVEPDHDFEALSTRR